MNDQQLEQDNEASSMAVGSNGGLESLQIDIAIIQRSCFRLCTPDDIETSNAFARIIDRLNCEREECAKTCEDIGRTTGECPELAQYCADAIRMRPNV